MRPNTPDPRRGLNADDAAEEFARQAMIHALDDVLWTFGVGHDSIFVIKMCRALGIPAPRHTPRQAAARQFPCEGCGVEVTTSHPNQRFCGPLCYRDTVLRRVRAQRRNTVASRSARTIPTIRATTRPTKTATTKASHFSTSIQRPAKQLSARQSHQVIWTQETPATTSRRRRRDDGC
jgi:hypothetical protein